MIKMDKGIYLIFLIFGATFLQEISTSSEDHNENSMDLHIREKRVIDKTLKRNRPIIFPHIPYLVSIYKTGVPYCGGSIITASVILTAAQCVSAHLNAYTIISGSGHVHAGIVQHNVTGKLVHDMYNPNTKQKNIALLHISPVINLDDSRNKLIALYQGNVPDYALGTLSGWGFLEEERPEKMYPRQLHSISVPILNHDKCRHLQSRYAPVLTDENICTYDQFNNKYASIDDTGAPLVVNSKLVGVLTLSGTRLNPNNPDVFIKVSHPLIRNWIITNTHIIEGWLY